MHNCYRSGRSILPIISFSEVSGKHFKRRHSVIVKILPHGMCVAWHIHIYRITHWFTKLLNCISYSKSRRWYTYLTWEKNSDSRTYPLISVHFLLYGLNVLWLSPLLYFFLSQCCCFFLASYLGIVKNFLK